MAEYFDFDKVSSKMDTLEGLYGDFLSYMEDMDLEISKKLNVSPNIGIYGDLGNKLYQTWKDNCAIFKNYYGLFKSWNDDIAEVYVNNYNYLMG